VGRAKGKSRLAWEHAKAAVRDALGPPDDQVRPRSRPRSDSAKSDARRAGAFLAKIAFSAASDSAGDVKTETTQ
jgi:hypothetical protein